MKLKVIRVEPTTQTSASGKKKYYVYAEDGDRYIAWGDWIEAARGKEIDATLKKGSFKGVDYTVIWPAKEAAAAHEEAPVPSEIAIKARRGVLAEDETTTTETTTGPGKLPREYWERRDKMMAKESALKSAAEVWSTKLSINPTEGVKQNPMDLAKEFYRWIMSEGE